MQQDYYDHYWSEGEKHTGQRQGYAPNFLKWMKSELMLDDRGTLRGRGLEAGCGDASFTKAFSQFFPETHAFDISSRQVEENKREHPRVHFRTHDLSQPLPYPDGHFDAIWCSEVLEHLFDPLFALREFHRTLHSQGKLLVTVPYHGRLKNVMIALFKWDHHFDPEYPHLRFFTNRTLKNITEKAGFNAISLQSCGMSQPLRDLLIPTNILMRAMKNGARGVGSSTPAQ